MDEKLYAKILSVVNEYGIITSVEYKKLCRKFTTKNVVEFMEKEMANYKDDEVEECVKKYPFYFEQDDKEDNNEYDTNYIHDDILDDYLKYIYSISLLTFDEEKEITKTIQKGQEELVIDRVCGEGANIYNRIDLAKILISINDEREIQLLIKLYKSGVLSIEEKNNINTYLSNYNKEEKILSISKLKELFPEYNFNAKGKLKPAFFEEQIKLLIESRKARTKLIESNLRLVVFIAKKYRYLGLDMMDLIQEGNIGLNISTYKFDTHKGCKISTYSTWWIRQSISRAVAAKSRMIRIPDHTYQNVRSIKSIIFEYENNHGNKPTVEELIELTGYSKSQIYDMQKLFSDTTSLDIPVGQEEDNTLIEFVTDDEENVELMVEKIAMKEAIMQALETLPPREKFVLCERYGINCENGKTLEQVGKELSVTRERIRQIELKGLRKLKNPVRSKYFKDFI